MKKNSLKFLIYLGFFLSGFSALGYQFLWIRALATFLINTTYSFSLILFTFLTGLALGSFLISRLINKIKKEIIFLSLIEYAIGLFSLFSLFIIYQFPRLIKLFALNLTADFLLLLLFTFFAVACLLLPPTIFMGMTYALGIKILTKNIADLGLTAGYLQGFNTIGCLFGSLLTGFLLLPHLATIGSGALLAFFNFLFATFLIFLATKKIFLRFLSFLPFLPLIFIILFLNKPVVLPYEVRSFQKYLNILYYKELPSGTVSVVENPTGERRIFVNGTEVISTTYPGLKTVRLMGILPLLFHPQPETVLVIGYGMGVTTSILAQSPRTKYLEAVEICEGVVKGSEFFDHFNHQVYKNEKVKIIVDDGRAFLTKSKKRYDIISCDPTHPIFGSGNLYTQEFFLLAKSHLKENGIMVIYLPFFALTYNNLLAIIKTFQSVFPNAFLFRALSHGILVGFLSSEIKFDYFSALKRLTELTNFDDLSAVNISLPEEILTTIFFDSLTLSNLTKNAQINTDDKPFIEFASARVAHNLRKTWIENLENLLPHIPSPYYLLNKYVEIKPYSQEIFIRLTNYLLAEKYKLKGIILKTKGEREKEEIAHYLYALKINPQDREAKMLLLLKMK